MVEKICRKVYTEGRTTQKHNVSSLSTGRLEVQTYSMTTTAIIHPFNGLFSKTTWVSQYQKGKTSLDLNEARQCGVFQWQWHQLDHMLIICTLLQTDNDNNTPSLNFYRTNALPGAQPTVSKHWRQLETEYKWQTNRCRPIWRNDDSKSEPKTTDNHLLPYTLQVLLL